MPVDGCEGKANVQMRIPKALLAEIDHRSVVNAELSSRNRFLPPDLAELAMADQAPAIAERLETLMRREFEPSAQDSVLARKAGRGSRPLPFITLNDRLVYRALVGTLIPRLPVVPGRSDYDVFARSPLDVPGCRFVLKADIAAYYQYIDHEQLIDEVVAQTGDDHAVTSVVELLQGGTGRRFGLPQMQSASDLLADLYIDPIRRSLIRGGHATFRYADDFRVSCDTYSEALASLELIERAAFDLGLFLNEGKTSTPHREKYEESLGDVSRAEVELFQQLAEQGFEVDDFFALVGGPYGETGDDATAESLGLPGHAHDETDPNEDTEPPEVPTSDQLEVAYRVVSLWNTDEGEQLDWGNAVWSALLRKSLFALEVGRDDRALSRAITLLVREPHLTPQVCGYLSAVGQEEPASVIKVLDEVCDGDIVSVWQSLWIAHLAGSVNSGTSRRRHVEWLRSQVNSRHDSVSAHAALALARRRYLDAPTAEAAYQRAPEVHRPTAALAMAAAKGAVGAEFIPENQSERWLADSASNEEWGQRAKRRVLRVHRPGK